MIKHSVRYDNYAYRLSDVPASAELIAAGWEEGEFLSFNENGELVKAKASTVPFMSMSSSRRGRQQFLGKTTTATAILFGPARVATTNYAVEDSYVPGAPLYVNDEGQATTAAGSYLIGYAAGEPVDNYLTIMMIPPVKVGA